MQKYEDELLRGFLLGKLPETEHAEIEEALLTDDAFSEYLAAIEAELVDSYTRGDLNGADRRAFETRYADEASSEEIRFAKTFAKLTSLHVTERNFPMPPQHLFEPDEQMPLAALLPNAVPDRLLRQDKETVGASRPFGTRLVEWLSASWPRTAALGLLAAVLVAVVLISLPRSHEPAKNSVARTVNQTPPDQPSRPARGTERAVESASASDATEQQTEGPHAHDANAPSQVRPRRHTDILSFILLPTERGVGDGNVLEQPSAPARINLTLGEPVPSYDRYEILITTVDGGIVFKNDARRSSEGRLSIEVPSVRLPVGDYMVRAVGYSEQGPPEDIAGYSFSVVLKH